MNKLLIENINRIRRLMLISEQIEKECIQGDCENGKGILKIPEDENTASEDFYSLSEKLFDGYFINGEPYPESGFDVTYKTSYGDVKYFGHINKEFGMIEYGELTFPDGTIYKGVFNQEKLGDHVKLDCDRIIKDNMVQNWDPYTQKHKNVQIDDLYDYHFLLPLREKEEEDKKKSREEEIQKNIKKRKEEEDRLKQEKEEVKKSDIEKIKNQQDKIESLLPKYVRDVQNYIDNKKCNLLYDKIKSMVETGKIDTIDKYNDFEELCQTKLSIDTQTGEPYLEKYSKYNNGLYDAITKSCLDYDWDFLSFVK